MNLAQLPQGERCIITAVDGSGAFRRRLLELGMLPGVSVTRSGRAPLGDPIAYRVRGAVVSLRKRDARLISVETP
ncbi:MAG: ferrous iron transport protein A [Myxococcota bacterium]